MPELPAGTVTFFFTDIEGSTRLLQRLGDRYAQVLADHHRLLRTALSAHHGLEVDTQGDAFFAVFSRARDALLAAVDAQRAIARGAWPEDVTMRVRIGVHTGEAIRTDAGYVGIDVHRASRICSVAHGGQVLLSQSTRNLIKEDLPEGISLRDLGEHRLRDLQRPERLFQLLHPDFPSEFPPLRSLDSLPNNLPRQLTSFIGREQEMAEAKRLLGKTFLLTLTGPGGSGKTRLALQVAADRVEEFRDGVWFVELASLEDPARVPQAVASTLAVREMPGRPLVDTLVDYLRAKEVLLVLDGCEHLIDACATLADTLLRNCPGLRILTTSREPLHIAGETTLRVPTLSIPDARHPVSVETLTRYDAIRLFVDRAVAAQPGFTLTDHNAPWVVQVCQRLDGIPLAIELAAARMNVLQVEQIAARLDDRFRLLTGGSRTASRRQQTLRAAIDWSYELLSEPERLFLRRLAVFAGGFTLDAAEAVCSGDGGEAEQVLDLLTRLVDRSLVMSGAEEAAGGEARFWMLETVRQYAAETLQREGEAQVVRYRHLEYFLALVTRADARLRGPEQITWLKTLDREYDNIRAAIRWGRTDGAAANATLRLTAALRWFWFTRGYLTEGRESLEGALGLAGGAPASDRAWALSAAAMLAWRHRDYAAAEALGNQSLALCREAQDDRACAYALNALALVARDQSDLDRAGSLHQETLDLFRKVGDRWGVALALQNLAYVAHRRGEAPRAARLCEESLAIFRDIGDRWGIATSLYVLGRISIRQGDNARATALFQEVSVLMRELGDKQGVAFALSNLGYLAVRQKEYDGAMAFLEESLAISREFGDKRGIADVTAHLGAVAYDRGDQTAAGSLYRESLALNAELGNRQGIAEGLERLAAVAIGQARPERAAVLLGAGDVLRERMGVPLQDADRGAVDRTLAAARSMLGEDGFAAAWSRAQAVTLQEAVAYALSKD